MSALWTNAGIDEAAQLWLGNDVYDTLTLRLFVNNHTPTVTDTAGNYTECTLAGYAAVALTPGNWSGSTSAGLATYTYPALIFTFSAYAGGSTIYGYYLQDADGNVILADLLSPAFAVPAGGGSVAITPTYEDQKF